MNSEEIDVLSDEKIPESVRSKIAERFVKLEENNYNREIEFKRIDLERQRIFWNTPLVIAIAGFLTLFGTFIFDILTTEAEVQGALTLEEFRQELQSSEARLRHLLEEEAKTSAAQIESMAREREFQFEIVRNELSDSAKTNAERAEVLLFLVEAGILRNLNADRLKETTSPQPSGRLDRVTARA